MARNAEQTLERDTPDLGIPQDDPNVTIDLDAEPDDGGDERATEGDRSDDEAPRGERVRDPKTGQWGAKKRARGEDRRGAQNWRQEKAQFETRIQTQQREHREALQAMQMRIDAMARQPAPAAGGGQPANPFAQRMTDLDAQLDTELKLIEADPKRDYKRYNELRRQETRLVAQEEAWRANQGQQRQQQPQGPQLPAQYAARVPFIEAEFPWTMDPNNAELNKKAMAYKQYLVNVQERLDTIDTDREALTWAVNTHGARFGIQAQAAAPSQRTQQLYQGPGQRGAPRRGNGSAREITVPRALLNGSGLSAAAIADALRED